MKTILITGANGFVGRALCRRLQTEPCTVVGAIRTTDVISSAADRIVPVGDISHGPDWKPLLRSADTVVHLAAVTHKTKAHGQKALQFFTRVNVDASIHLMEQCVECDIRRFIYVSSIKANGEYTDESGPGFSGTDRPRPQSIYGATKFAAEQRLISLAEEKQMDLIILRPPLIFGPGQVANMALLVRAVRSGIPLPFAGIQNLRSLLYVDNFADAIRTVIFSPMGGQQRYTLADVTLSTPQLVEAIAGALGTRARMFSIPPTILELAAATIGKRVWVERLTRSLAVDASAFKQTFQWEPATDFDLAMAETVGNDK